MPANKFYLVLVVLFFCFTVSAQVLETRPFEMKGCIQMIFQRQFVIEDEASFLKTIRNDLSRENCLKNLEKIDFAKHALVGIDIDSGYCRFPAGLQYELLKAEDQKQYVLSISYIDPKGRICRAMSHYGLWLLVPKLPGGYEIKFEVKARQE